MLLDIVKRVESVGCKASCNHRTQRHKYEIKPKYIINTDINNTKRKTITALCLLRMKLIKPFT